METEINSLFLALGLLIVLTLGLALAVTEWQWRRPRSLSEYSKAKFQLAFQFAAEERASVVNRGSMSQREFVRLQKLNLRRIDDELKRRSLVK